MKKKDEQTQALRFPYRFTRALKILCVASLVLCVLGIGVSVYRMIKFGVKDLNDFIRYPFLVIICVGAIVIVTALLIRSEYVIKDDYLYSNFGFLKSRVELKKLTAVVSDIQEQKLTVYMGEEFFVATLPKGENEKLAEALLKANPKIDYSFTLTENKPPEEDEKK